MGKEITIIGIDISKMYFQLHGATASGEPVLRRQLTRPKLLGFLAKQPVCRVVMEVCGLVVDQVDLDVLIATRTCGSGPVRSLGRSGALREGHLDRQDLGNLDLGNRREDGVSNHRADRVGAVGKVEAVFAGFGRRKFIDNLP